jgi:cation diffusion facilitator CzcD-associated flavoprotein CzcO
LAGDFGMANLTSTTLTSTTLISTTRQTTDLSLDVAIVGAGFAGLYMLHRCQEMGLEARIFEAGSDLGGTWFWNRYPGARCDIPSLEYSYQFSEELQQEWEWSEKYASQDEILRYANHVADRFGLRPNIKFDTRVEAASYSAEKECWTVRLAPHTELTAKFVVMATGCLSVPNYPNIEGLDSFEGEIFHTGKWPHEGVDFNNKKVAVIGTGSSAIQSIPLIAEKASQVNVFQRTPNYSIPAYNGPNPEALVETTKARYAEFRAENWLRGFGANFDDNELSAWDVSDEERLAEYERRWQKGGLQFLAAYSDLVFDDKANATARDFIRGKIAEQLDDKSLVEKLLPSTPVGCKRLCVDTDYYQTYNQAHVNLIDLNEVPITRIEAGAVIAGNGSEERFEADVIVLATGFDAMTGAVSNIEISALGRTLQEAWRAGPKAYLGLMTEGFPNLFLVTGPGSPSVLSNMLPSIEHHVEWIADCIAHIGEHQAKQIKVEGEAQEAWVRHVNEVAETSVYPRCNSWYLGANVEGKERVFMPYLGVPPYVEKCADVVARGYEGFVIS